MTCHHCRKDHAFLLFGRYCMKCWRKAPSVAALARATREFLHPPDKEVNAATSRERWRQWRERKKVESRDVPR